MTDPTAKELLFARRWAAAQSPAVTVERVQFDDDDDTLCIFTNLPPWLANDICKFCGDERKLFRIFKSADSAWSALAIALRPVRASLAGVIAEDEREWCIEVCEEIGVTGSASDGAEHIRRAAAIRAQK